MEKFAKSKTFKDELMTQLNLINNLLIHYYSQFQLVVDANERFFRKYYKNYNIDENVWGKEDVMNALNNYLKDKEKPDTNKTGGKRKTRRNKKSKASRRAVRKTGTKKKTQKKRPNKRGIKMYGK